MIYKAIFTTESLPVLGSIIGALSQISKFIPEWSAVTSLIILTIVGTLTGYGLKLLLDWLFSKIKK